MRNQSPPTLNLSFAPFSSPSLRFSAPSLSSGENAPARRFIASAPSPANFSPVGVAPTGVAAAGRKRFSVVGFSLCAAAAAIGDSTTAAAICSTAPVRIASADGPSAPHGDDFIPSRVCASTTCTAAAPTQRPVEEEQQVSDTYAEGTNSVELDEADVDLGYDWSAGEAKKKEADAKKERVKGERYKVAFALDQQRIDLDKEKFEFKGMIEEDRLLRLDTNSMSIEEQEYYKSIKSSILSRRSAQT
uniref:No apical meristem-associated C-terminal domain-containing protein n=1 Tax=Oryza punctata TaxID=4537 RepID=A0A0E0KZJ6_ORYPU